MIDRILVSICCVTYNHQPYIKDCLDGFLMQKGNFDIEVLIHDDASTDGTKEIINTYSEQYPDIFFPIFQKENQYSKGIRGFTAKYNFPRCRGKYIALCEGDDYWTDPTKIQQQVDFLEKNEDYVLSGHDAIKITNEGVIVAQSCLDKIHQRDYSDTELKQAHLVPTLTMCFRNVSILKQLPKEAFKVTVADLFLISLLGQFGKYKYFTSIKPAAYRVHTGGIWSTKKEIEKKRLLLITAKQLRNYYNRIGDKPIERYHSKKVLMYSLAIFKHSIEEQKNIIHRIKQTQRFIIDNRLITSPMLFIKYLYFNKLRSKS